MSSSLRCGTIESEIRELATLESFIDEGVKFAREMIDDEENQEMEKAEYGKLLAEVKSHLINFATLRKDLKAVEGATTKMKEELSEPSNYEKMKQEDVDVTYESLFHLEMENSAISEEEKQYIANIEEHINSLLSENSEPVIQDNKIDSEEIIITEDLKSYKDPITKRQIVYPVRNTECSHVYERNSIIDYIKNSKMRICPVGGCKCILDKEKLVDDLELKAELAKMAQK